MSGPNSPRTVLAVLLICIAPLAIASECSRHRDDWLFCADFDHDDLRQWDALPEGQSRTLLRAPGPAFLSAGQVVITLQEGPMDFLRRVLRGL